MENVVQVVLEKEEEIPRSWKVAKVSLHVLSGVILACSLLFSIFYFDDVFFRVIQSFEDFGRAGIYWLGELLEIMEMKYFPQTINDVPPNAVEVLPFDPHELKAKFGKYFQTIFTKGNLKGFGFLLLSVLAGVGKALLPLAIILGLLYFWIKSSAKRYRPAKEEKTEGIRREKRDVSSKVLKVFLAIERHTWKYLKDGCILYAMFLKKWRIYLLSLGLIWAYNLNLFTIGIEGLGYLLYLSASKNFLSVFIQIAKLAMDSSVFLFFFPTWAKVIIGYVGFDVIRCWTAGKLLWTKEEHNERFLKEHPGALYVIGRQRMGKTTAITDMARTEERVFREEALKGMLLCEKQFPYVPWVNIDHFHQTAYESGKIHLIAEYEPLIKKLRLHFKYRHRYETKEGKFMKDFLLWRYKELYGYDFSDFIFNYEHEDYPLKHNNGWEMVDVFDAIQDYMEQLYIYAAPTPLVFGNYSIRSDVQIDRSKVFPKVDANYLKRRPQDLYAISEYCHIADQDAMRLGKLVKEDNPYKDGFEIGIDVETEFAKERGNVLTNRGQKADADESNVANDRYEMNVKMQSQAATIANFTFLRRLYDDQRCGALGADNRDLCTVVHIKQRGKDKCTLPFAGIERGLNWLASKFYDNTHMEEKYAHADYTLTMYLLRKIVMPIFHYTERRINKYSYHEVKLKVKDGSDDELLDGNKYFIIHMKDYSGVFATDTWKSFYRKKARRSKYGLNDFPQYKGKRMTTDEMNMVHSHLFNQMNEVFLGEGEVA